MSTDLKLIAVGDLAFNGHYHWLLRRRGADSPLRAVAPLWRDADLRMGNLESPLTTAARFSDNKCTLRGTPSALDALLNARFNYVSLANNHLMDYGPQGVEQTLEQLRQRSLPASGAGADLAQSLEPAVIERRDQRVAIFSWCDVAQQSPLYATSERAGVAPFAEQGLTQVAQWKTKADWRIVHLHWGDELCQLPSPEQRAFARRLVEAGADLIVGHHPHVLQPIEWIERTPVIYSLGNFLFSSMLWGGQDADGNRFSGKLRVPPLGRETGWVDVHLRKGKRAEVQFHPARLNRLQVVPDRRPARLEKQELLTRQLASPDYPALYQLEKERSLQRLAEQESYRSPIRWLELKLFHHGLWPRWSYSN